MPSPSDPAREASAADHAHAAALVVHLLRAVPEAVVWRPGVASWGVCVLAGSVRAVVALDGCLGAVVRLYPGRLPDRRYRLDALARLLLGPLQIKRLEARTLFRCQLPGSPDGRCCVLITDADLPWLCERIVCGEATSLHWMAGDATGDREPSAGAGQSAERADGAESADAPTTDA